MSVPSIRALIDARRATSAPHVPRRCPVCWPPDVLERVFPESQCDWEYVAQREGRLNMPEPWATHLARAQVAAAADRRPIDDERNDP